MLVIQDYASVGPVLSDWFRPVTQLLPLTLGFDAKNLGSRISTKDGQDTLTEPEKVNVLHFRELSNP